MKKLISFITHLTVFVVIEILFVFVILHEFPHISLIETIGIVHLSYRIMLIIAGVIRDKLKKYRHKFLATYIPVIYHILGHIYVSYITIESIENHHHHSITWMIIATFALGILIFIGERLIHKKFHCDTCHAHIHKDCPKQ